MLAAAGSGTSNQRPGKRMETLQRCLLSETIILQLAVVLEQRTLKMGMPLVKTVVPVAVALTVVVYGTGVGGSAVCSGQGNNGGASGSNYAGGGGGAGSVGFESGGTGSTTDIGGAGGAGLINHSIAITTPTGIMLRDRIFLAAGVVEVESRLVALAAQDGGGAQELTGYAASNGWKW